MVDTQRFNIGPATVQLISRVAHELARRHGRVTVLQVVPWVPFDVDSVARVLESLDELPTTHRVEGEDGIDYWTFTDGFPTTQLESGEHLKAFPGYERNLRSFSDDADWVKRTRVQHTMLSMVAGSPRPYFSCDFVASRCKFPGSKVQSSLNDFAAQKYIHMKQDQGEEALYIFPKISYPASQLDKNLKAIAPAEETGRVRRHWWLVAVLAAVVVAIVLMELW